MTNDDRCRAGSAWPHTHHDPLRQAHAVCTGCRDRTMTSTSPSVAGRQVRNMANLAHVHTLHAPDLHLYTALAVRDGGGHRLEPSSQVDPLRSRTSPPEPFLGRICPRTSRRRPQCRRSTPIAGELLPIPPRSTGCFPPASRITSRSSPAPQRGGHPEVQECDSGRSARVADWPSSGRVW